MTHDLDFSTVDALSQKIKNKSLSPVELTRHCLKRIDTLNPELNAFVVVYREAAQKAAQQCAEDISRGDYRGPLHGVPIAVKDNCDIAGQPTTAGSKALLDNVPARDAAFIQTLRKVGAILIGKTNMHELAYGGTGDVSHFGPTRNPWNRQRIAGGSSSGSAAAVAAGMVPAAVGTDTGGSVRIPSSTCGITGYKPTYGAVSRQGVLPLSWSLDHVGPLALSLRDVLTVHTVLSLPGRVTTGMDQILSDGKLPKHKLGAARFPHYALDPQVEKVYAEALKHFESLGLAVKHFDLSHTAEAHSAWLAIMYAEASTRYRDLLASRYFDFSENCRTQLEAGKYLRAETYLNAHRFRGFYIRYFQLLMNDYDALIFPSLPTTAPRIGQKDVQLPNKTVSTQDAMTFTNLTANMLGWPALSIPCGFSDDHLPVGLTVLMPPDREAIGLKIANAYQTTTEWHLRHPAVG